MNRYKNALTQSITVSLAAMLVVGCASKEERELASGSFKYVEMSEGKTIKIPEGIDSPEFSDEFIGERSRTSCR